MADNALPRDGVGTSSSQPDANTGVTGSPLGGPPAPTPPTTPTTGGRRNNPVPTKNLPTKNDPKKPSSSSSAGSAAQTPPASKPILDKKLNARNFYDPHRLETFSDDYAVKAIPAMFITTPMLNFDANNISQNSFFKYLNDTDPELLSLLSFGGRAGGNTTVNTSPFIRILSNRFDSFTTKATVSQPKEVGETYYGFKQYLPGPTVNSVSGDTVSIEYTETGGMEILSLHKAWLDYIEGLSRGILKPGNEARTNRFLDYTSSIYLFSLAPDGETIVFYEKLTGCSPISAPYDVFTSKAVNDREIIKYSIEYTYSFKEDLNPRSLLTFNALSSSTVASGVASSLASNPTIYGLPAKSPNYNNTTDYYANPDNMKASTPVIVQDVDAEGRKVFKLKYTNSNQHT